MVNDSRIWITWEIQRRNKSLSREVGATLYELVSDRPLIARYFSLAIKTLRILKNERPGTVFAQNPSIVLSFLVVLFRPLFGYMAVIDEHNSGLFPLEGNSRLLNQIARYIARKADFAIVTNENLAAYVRALGGQPIVLPDPLPRFSDVSADQGPSESHTKESLELLFICTWAADEPYLEVIEAARRSIDLPVRIWVTGNPKNKIGDRVLPPNIKLTGFIPDSEYIGRLASSDAVVVLTTREDCLNCGAYEAVSLGKPGILSDTQALRAYFKKGFIFSRPDTDSLVEALRALLAQFPEMKHEVSSLREELEGEYATRLRALDVLTPSGAAS